MHSVFRMPQNTFRHGDFFFASEIGVPKLRYVCVSCAAALYRTATKTLSNWPKWIAALDSTSAEFLPINPLFRGKRSPIFWDSPPIVSNLEEAFLGYPRDPRWSAPASSLIQELSFLNHGPLIPGQPISGFKGSIQKRAYNKFLEGHFRCDIAGLIENRVTKIFHPYEVNFQTSVILENNFQTLSTIVVLGF